MCFERGSYHFIFVFCPVTRMTRAVADESRSPIRSNNVTYPNGGVIMFFVMFGAFIHRVDACIDKESRVR